MGKLVDHFGPKRMWSLSAVVQGALFLAWPFIDSFPEYVALAVAMEVAGTLGGTAHGAYVIDILPPAERVESRAYMYSALNVGFSIGAFLGAGAIAFGTDALRWAPVLSAVLFLANSAAILRLPDASHDVRSSEPRVKPEGIPAIRNRAWIAVTTFTGVMWTNQVLLHTVIPVWLVTETDAPKVLVAILFGTNTLMCIVLPRLASRGIHDISTALRAVRLSTLFFVLTCLITLATHETVGWITIVLFFLGHVVLTWAELFLSASGWTLEAELMDPRRRGDYQGVSELGGTLGRFWAPAVYGFLAMEWGAFGWLTIAAIVTAGAAGLHVAAHAGPPLPRAARAGRRPGRRTRRRPRRRRTRQRPDRPRCSKRTRHCQNPPVTSPADWLAGARPRTLPAAVAPVLAGTGVAAYVDEAVWWKALLALVVSLALQVGVNYANDYSDGVRGTDADRVGPMRLVGSGAASPRAVKTAAFAAFGVAAAAGLVLAATTAWWLVAVGLVCVVAAWFYTGGEKPYGYLGLGEVMVFVFFGLVAVIGTTYVQTETWEWPALYAGVGVGALACAILVANNLRDIPTDTVSGKRTLAVRLGDERTRSLYAFLVLVAAAAVVAVAVATTWWALVGLGFLARALPPTRAVLGGATGPALIPVLAATGAAELIWSVLVAVPLLLVSCGRRRSSTDGKRVARTRRAH